MTTEYYPGGVFGRILAKDAAYRERLVQNMESQGSKFHMGLVIHDAYTNSLETVFTELSREAQSTIEGQPEPLCPEMQIYTDGLRDMAKLLLGLDLPDPDDYVEGGGDE